MADILAFPGNPGAPVQPLTRPEFGRLPVGYWSRDLKDGLEAAGADDAAQQENFKRIARELRAAKSGHVCPSLLKAKAGHAEGLAQALRSLAAECKALGAVKQADTFNDAADHVETAGVELEAEAQ